MQEKVIYRMGMESTVESARQVMTQRLRERLKAEAAYDDDARAAQYPLTTLDRVVNVLSSELYGAGRSVEESHYELGKQALRRYQHSTIGKALFALIRVFGPMRFLKRTPALFRQPNNYAEVTFEVKGKSSYELEHNEVGTIPHYYRGLLVGAGECLSLRAQHCALLWYDGHRARYRVSWEE